MERVQLILKSLKYPGYCFWIALVYLLGSNFYGVPFTGDAKVYVGIAMEMRHAHEWLFPILFGEHSYYKPPFVFWTLLASWKIFGFNELGTHFPSAIATGAAAWAMGAIHQELKPQSKEITSGLFFAGSAGALTYGGTAQMEIWVVFFYLISWLCFIQFLSRKNWPLFYLALFLAGISAYVKSPLYSIFTVAGFWIYLFLENRLDVFKNLNFYLAHFLGIAAGSAWYFVMLYYDYQAFWDRYIITETLNKRFGNGGTVIHLLADSCTHYFPLILPVFVALIFLPKLSYIIRLLVSACVLPVLFFLIFPYKTETYLFIIAPFLFMILDGVLTLHAMRAVFKLNALIAVLLIAILAFVAKLSGIVSPVLALALFFSGIGFLIFSWTGNYRAIGFAMLTIVLMIRLCSLWIGETDIRDLKLFVDQNPNREIYFCDFGKNIWSEIGTLSSGIAHPMTRVFSPEDARALIDDGKTIIATDDDRNQIFPASSEHLHFLKWTRWQRGFTLPTPSGLKSMATPGSPEWESRFKKVEWVIYR